MMQQTWSIHTSVRSPADAGEREQLRALCRRLLGMPG